VPGDLRRPIQSKYSVIRKLTGVPGLRDVSDPSLPHFAYFHPTPESINTAISALETYVLAEGPFDGIIGFSQGASLAVMWLTLKAYNNPEAPPPVSCAILFSRVLSYDPVTWHATGVAQKLENVPDGGRRIQIPVANLWGANDREDVLEYGPATANLFDEQGYWSYVHPGGHEVPGLAMREALKKTAKIAKRSIMQAQMAAESLDR